MGSREKARQALKSGAAVALLSRALCVGYDRVMARVTDDYGELVAHDDPDGPVPELVDGRIVYKAMTKFRHGRTALRLARALDRFDDDDDDPDGWWISTEPDVRLGPGRIVRPDLAGWRRTRSPDPPDDEDGPIELAPDWCCEVLSRGHEVHDTRTKRRLYLEAGVPHYWLVSPMARTLEAFERVGDRWTLLGTWTDGDRPRVAPFEAVEIDVGRLYVPIRPR